MASLDLHSAMASCACYPVHVDLHHRMLWFAEVELQNPRHLLKKRFGFTFRRIPRADSGRNSRFG